VSRRRAATGLSGILLVDKPAGMTSHDVVDVVRRATGERRVGHAGTLDPLATGLLVVLVGPAARLAPWLTAAEKTYEALVAFGSETDTDDADGTITRTADVPETLSDPAVAERAVAALVGEHAQVPPAFSAIKVAGKTSHRVARAGGEVTLEPRSVSVFDARLLGVIEGPPLAWDVEVSVSKGTYVRAVARDLGRTLGTAAHLGELRRTRSGGLDVTDALTLERIEAAGPHITDLLSDPVAALGLPVVAIDTKSAALVSHGATLPRDVSEPPFAEHAVAVVHDGRLLAVYESEGAYLRPVTVLPGGVA
jgi:tRNA pseudouridine55 synthase